MKPRKLNLEKLAKSILIIEDKLTKGLDGPTRADEKGGDM